MAWDGGNRVRWTSEATGFDFLGADSLVSGLEARGQERLLSSANNGSRIESAGSRGPQAITPPPYHPPSDGGDSSRCGEMGDEADLVIVDLTLRHILEAPTSLFWAWGNILFRVRKYSLESWRPVECTSATCAKKANQLPKTRLRTNEETAQDKGKQKAQGIDQASGFGPLAGDARQPGGRTLKLKPARERHRLSRLVLMLLLQNNLLAVAELLPNARWLITLVDDRGRTSCTSFHGTSKRRQRELSSLVESTRRLVIFHDADQAYRKAKRCHEDMPIHSRSVVVELSGSQTSKVATSQVNKTHLFWVLDRIVEIVKTQLTGLGKNEDKSVSILVMPFYKAQIIEFQRQMRLMIENRQLPKSMLQRVKVKTLDALLPPHSLVRNAEKSKRRIAAKVVLKGKLGRWLCFAPAWFGLRAFDEFLSFVRLAQGDEADVVFVDYVAASHPRFTGEPFRGTVATTRARGLTIILLNRGTFIGWETREETRKRANQLFRIFHWHMSRKLHTRLFCCMNSNTYEHSTDNCHTGPPCMGKHASARLVMTTSLIRLLLSQTAVAPIARKSATVLTSVLMISPVAVVVQKATRFSITLPSLRPSPATSVE
ncbi:hypothetical protein NM208_g12752 [Fusarium decemcellulare]|uniref:Uncharacterized protein n=1 Tax=Fusarium decemcellulare TaxID=57161 RepID=A0ACC1RRT8_9HYPO|nr:hypothetical protein NM208_g12752 [Fusarium decemcellulare]